MRVTQQDIAKIANVSQATVSRVLAGDPRVEPVKRELILRTMQVSNYKPDVRARALRSQRTQLVGLVHKRSGGEMKDDPFFASLVAEIVQFLSHTQYHLCLDVVSSADEQGDVYDELLRSRRVDGLILVEPESEDKRLARLMDDKFPFVVLGNPRGKALYSVDNDNVLAGRLATQHLIENGYRSIGMLAGPAGVAVSDDRATGYRMAMAEHRMVPKVWHSEFGFRAAAEEAIAILVPDQRPDALVVMDDFMALGLIKTARQFKLAVPDDLAVVCFNVSSLCTMVEGGLTSVNMNIEQLVRHACSKLIDVVEAKTEGESSRSLVSCELVVRNSCRPCARVL